MPDVAAETRRLHTKLGLQSHSKIFLQQKHQQARTAFQGLELLLEQREARLPRTDCTCQTYPGLRFQAYSHTLRDTAFQLRASSWAPPCACITVTASMGPPKRNMFVQANDFEAAPAVARASTAADSSDRSALVWAADETRRACRVHAFGVG